MLDDRHVGVARPGRETWLEHHGINAWTAMARIRELELRLPSHSEAGDIPGSAHPAVGMEAVAVGVSLELRTTDWITSTHRGHAHCLAKGAEPWRLLAEIFGRADGYCRGRGGSMHIAARDLGILGTNGIVGAGIGIATGAGLAGLLTGGDDIAVAYLGEGATNQGIFHESLNLASIWRLPVVYVCENNHFAQSSRIEEMVNVPDLARRADAYGIPGVTIDGMDVIAVNQTAAEAVSRARGGDGPSLLVADTYRYLGHMVGDTEIYRDEAERARWRERDPLERLVSELLEHGLVDTPRLETLRAGIRDEIDEAVARALASPVPDAVSAVDDVYGAYPDSIAVAR